MKAENRREKYLVFLILLSLYLSLLETFIPKPFPWLKLGLSNIGTLFSPGFIISLVSGSASVCIMVMLYSFRDRLSLVSISVFSALVHNFTQLIVVYFLLFRNMNINSRYVMVFVTGFLMLGVFAGAVTGFIGENLLLRRSCVK